MPGGDQALIKSLEATEDVPVLGHLHLQDRGLIRGDVVICITESGETASVISTILTALDQWKGKNHYDGEKTKKKLFFVYNNPYETLLPFERSRKVLEEPGISKVNLTTGPQAIAGSTRMQAATINAFVLGHAVETAIDRALRRFLSNKEMTKLGFQDSLTLEERLEDFAAILKQVKKKIPVITKWTLLEAKTYIEGHYSTYLANKGLIAVLTDSAERATTFLISPLDTIKEQKRKCWAQVWTTETSLEDAWKSLLGRPFRGLSSISVDKTPADEINDSQLPQGALENLKRSGSEIPFLYDLSFSDFNLQTRGPQEGDLGALVAISPEEFQLEDKKSDFLKFVTLFLEKGARISLLFITGDSEKKIATMTDKIPGFDPEEQDVLVIVPIDSKNDPLGINQCIALKIILNAHSTAVMARMGRVIGNTTVDVNLHSLKNIGRATYLVQSLVNDVLIRPRWVRLHGIQKPTSYGEANAVLYEALSFMEDKRGRIDGAAEVALSVVRILESLRLKKSISHEEAMKIVQGKGFRQYLRDVANQAE
jgi:N-acetylmuramic acid 6-phosphate etherase